uniref:Uncharacterized protein n=1 Tax=Panagrolaimus davidi TaxID=227884 RepID=A0A914PEC1_9BILA
MDVLHILLGDAFQKMDNIQDTHENAEDFNIELEELLNTKFDELAICLDEIKRIPTNPNTHFGRRKKSIFNRYFKLKQSTKEKLNELKIKQIQSSLDKKGKSADATPATAGPAPPKSNVKPPATAGPSAKNKNNKSPATEALSADAYNTTPDHDDEAVNQAVAMPPPIIPPIRPQLQNRHLINPNLLGNPFIEAQQQQIFMNQQMLQQQQQQQIAYQQQIVQFQWQQMMAQNRFRFP